MLIRAVLALLLPLTVSAHIKLVYPPARIPALDYYSTSNSEAPCGVKKPAAGDGVRTFLKSGSTVEMNWFVAVPHMGGIRLEVLNSSDEPIAIFTNFNDDFNVTETSKKVELPPNFECKDCAIRMTTQATEYGNSFFFFSCADINIVADIPDGDTCLGNGNRMNGKCRCFDGFFGDDCQFQDECQEDDDCGVQGYCRLGGESPRRQCFCPVSRYGKNCELESDSIRSMADFDETLYQKREDQGNKIYWRLLKDEIEFVLRYPGNSWVGLGWKSPEATCELSPADFANRHTSPTSTIASIITNATTHEQNDAGDHECGPNEQWSECPESSRECEHSCDWTHFPETTPNCPNSCGKARCICKEGFVRMANDQDVCVPFDFCDKTVENEETCVANSTWAKCGVACEPTCANMYDTSPCPASCEKPGCTCADNYVRHNGRCIYWGDCPEVREDKTTTTHAKVAVETTQSTIDRNEITQVVEVVKATTQKVIVTECSLNETLNECGRICEADCVSIFTRSECTDCGSAACACLQGYARNTQGQCVYWGDCPTDDQPAPTVSASATSPTTPTPTTTAPPSVNGDVCYGDFRYPAGCSDCEYKLSWNYVEESDEIEFSLETRLSENSWTGVGFSKDGTMLDADMIIVTTRNGKIQLNDMQSRGYDQPAMDAEQNVKSATEVIGTHANGVLRAQFVRNVNTGDATDKQFDGEQCWKMLYPIAGGKLDQYGNVSIHLSTPVSSDKPICIRSCTAGGKGKKTGASSTSSPSTSSSTSSSSQCINEYRYPEGCTGDECDYTAKWNYDSSKKDVRFEITSKTPGRWTGIGFSRDGQMTNADMYTGWFFDGKAYIVDRFAYGRQLPAIDPADRQDIYDLGGKVEDEMQTIWFRRKLISKDTKTDVSLDECHYFLFPIGGGRVLARKSSDFTNPKTPIGYHDQVQPQVSATKICLCDESGKTVAHQSKAPISRRVRRAATRVATSAMHCTDMVVGMVSNGRARIMDMYSPSKATPMQDTFFGGENSLTSAAAFQEDGVTTLVFRKKIQAEEKWDNSFTNGPMTVIWAKGADPMNYVHTTGGAPIKASPEFFENAMKYHGKNARGVMTINFFEETTRPQPPTVHGMHLDMNTCEGSIHHPEGCTGSDCVYTISWISDGSVARFSIHGALATSQWTALGFSTDGNMASADAVVIGIQNNAVMVTDQFMPSYGRPVVDEQQDIFDVETTYVNGYLTANFSRELHSEDEFDVDLQECVFLLYTPFGGVIEKNGEIRKHESTPLKSTSKICLNKCTEQKVAEPVTSTETAQTSEPVTAESTSTTTDSPTTTEATTTTKKTIEVATTTKGGKVLMPPMRTHKPYTVYEPENGTAKRRYGLRVRILNRDFNEALNDPKTGYYQDFTQEVTQSIDELLAKRWKGMRVSKILGYEKGSVIAEFEVVAVDETAKTMEIKSMFEENAVRGAIGAFSIEPSTIKVSEVDTTTVPSEEDIFNNWAMWRNILIIAACSVVSLIVVLCICFMCCTKCFRSSRTYSAYPVADAHMSYASRMLGEKGGFDNAIYNQPQRYYSQTTVASTKMTSASPPEPNANGEGPPGGVGETTYAEWYSKVGSKPSSQQHEEVPPQPPLQSRPPSTTPYVSYPNDPTGYYTLGGRNRQNSGSNGKFTKY
uniref:DOMON domain-containing protein n=1 Tax=Caenorhabditis japonica TaxID=281687 RepID=A0A8R1DKC4_CAEJA